MSEVQKSTETKQQPSRDVSAQGQEAPALRPPADVFEHEGGITLRLDMPGVSKERLNIQTDNNSLVVEGTMDIDVPEHTESLYADVRSTQYRRAFSLSGEHLDIGAVAASLKNGVLQVDIPKREEFKPRKIEVKTS